MISLETLQRGIKNPIQAALYLLSYPGAAASSRGLLGTNVFNFEWDVLVLLDTCRVDALRMVADEYSFLNNIGRIVSVGSSSPEWIAATFRKQWREEIAETAYLASNGYAQVILEDRGSINENTPDELNVSLPDQFQWKGTDWSFVDSNRLGKLEHIWRYEPKNRKGSIGHIEGDSPPRYVTDRGIDVMRNQEYERVILHYNQPHSPYVSNALKENRGLEEFERDPFGYMVKTGDRETVFNSYLDDLRYVLDEVRLLLDNIDARKVVISADHGEAFGEYGDHGHLVGTLHPKVRMVPWAVTSAQDSGEYSPKFEPLEANQRNIKDTLEALGYKP